MYLGAEGVCVEGVWGRDEGRVWPWPLRAWELPKGRVAGLGDQLESPAVGALGLSSPCDVPVETSRRQSGV